ncbi:T2 family ribonuclease [Indivirus ILV1]|uniref:T2 family ribonuclease n=1 Tax=Indivirus ILV1 TaxID=1977633 RepID=A0A1V0SDZ8_9VIRU|nr:T2 family ribonuclease [Indivirus ILV1]
MHLLTTLFLLSLQLPLYYCYTDWDYILFVQVWPGSWINNGPLLYKFNNSYFTIHGLWPQYYNGSWPQFCNHDKFNYLAIKNISQYLEMYWTNFKNAKDLWVHEYKKHATCAENDPLLSTEYQYFLTGLILRNKYNIFSVLKNNSIVPSNIIKYSTKGLVKVLSKGFNNTIVMLCNENNILNEIRFCLDKNLEQFDCPSNELKEQCQNKYISYNFV